jgi:hypothetical protein
MTNTPDDTDDPFDKLNPPWQVYLVMWFVSMLFALAVISGIDAIFRGAK